MVSLPCIDPKCCRKNASSAVASSRQRSFKHQMCWASAPKSVPVRSAADGPLICFFFLKSEGEDQNKTSGQSKWMVCFVFLQIFEKKMPAQNGISPPCFSSILFTVNLVWVNLRVGPLSVSSNCPSASSKKNGFDCFPWWIYWLITELALLYLKTLPLRPPPPKKKASLLEMSWFHHVKNARFLEKTLCIYINLFGMYLEPQTTSFYMDVWWFPTISHVKVWLIIQLKQPFNTLMFLVPGLCICLILVIHAGG